MGDLLKDKVLSERNAPRIDCSESCRLFVTAPWRLGGGRRTEDPCAWEDQTQFAAADTKNTQRYLIVRE
jgi:hypothetical protein